MSTKTRDEALSLILNKVKLLKLQPGAHGPLTKILIAIFTISRMIQLYYAIKLISYNTSDLLLMANGAKTVAIMCQVKPKI